MKSLFAEVKDFSSQTLTGMKRLNYKSELLTKLGTVSFFLDDYHLLGAPPEKKRKVPFRIQIGLKAGRERLL